MFGLFDPITNTFYSLPVSSKEELTNLLAQLSQTLETFGSTPRTRTEPPTDDDTSSH